MKKALSLISCLSLFALVASAQQWMDQMSDPNVNFYELQETFYEEMGDLKDSKGRGYKQFKRYEWFMEPRVYPSGDRSRSINPMEEARAFEKIYGKGNQLAKTASWRPLGPDDWQNYSYSPGLGRINSIRVDPKDSLTIYIGTPSGGCWKTTDGGQNWMPLADDLAIIGVSDIAISPLNSNHLYIATGDGFGADTYSIGILKSTDGGQTWVNTALSLVRSQNVSMRRMLIHPQNPDTLWVATNVGLYRTNDGGSTWINVLNDNIRSVKMHPTDTNIVYATTDQFYRSTDGGTTFAASNNGTGMNSPAQINRMEIAVSSDSADVVYAVCGKQSDQGFYALYRSNDAGLNWQRMSTTPNILSHDINGLNNGGQSGYDLAIAVNPQDANDVFVGGINVWRSIDGGSNWSIKSHWVINNNAGYTHADIHALDFYNNVLYCGSDGGIFTTSDLGNSWNDLSDGLEITQFYRFSQTEQSDTILIGGAQDNGSLLRTDSMTWAHVYGADGMDNAIDPQDPRVMYFTSQFGNIQRSYNGGVTKSGVSGSIRSQENGAWVTPFQIDPNNRFALVAAYENVWYSPNRGSSWVQLSSWGWNNTLRTLKVAPSNSNVIYTAPNNNSIRKTTDRGQNWTVINSRLPSLAISDIEVHPTDPDSVWITFSGFNANRKAYVSGNGGSTWQNISANLPNLPANTIAIDTATGIEYVGTDVGVYYRNRNVSPFWQSYMTGLPNVIVTELEIHYRSGMLRASTYGRGIWESPLMRPTITSVKETKQLSKKSGFLVYPNPNKSLFALQDEAAQARLVSVFDLKGKKVQQIALNQQTVHQVDLSRLPQGLYLLRIVKQNGEIEQLKVQLQP